MGVIIIREMVGSSPESWSAAAANAVARAYLSTYGDPGIALLKFAALVLLVVAWKVLPNREATVVLAGFASISLLTVALNAMTLASI